MRPEAQLRKKLTEIFILPTKKSETKQICCRDETYTQTNLIH